MPMFGTTNTTQEDLREALNKIQRDFNQERSKTNQLSINQITTTVQQTAADITENQTTISALKTTLQNATQTITQSQTRLHQLEEQMAAIHQIVTIQETKIDNLCTAQVKSNKLIALNMFAIVRMELGTSIDRIINDALTVKRHHTGSGNAKLASECAASIAIMAGNIISAGGMAAIGQVVCGTAGLLNSAIHNDTAGVISGAGKTAGGASDVALEKQLLSLTDTSFQGEQLKTNASTTNLNAMVSSLVEQINAPIDAKKAHEAATLIAKDPEDKWYYDPTKNHVMFIIPHGAGGTYAITQDVKQHVTNAYAKMTEIIEAEVSTGDSSPVLLDMIAGNTSIKQENKCSLHPLTVYVLENALSTLHNYSTAYKKCQSASRTITGNKLGYAKHAVNEYYKDVRTKLIGGDGFEMGATYFKLKQDTDKRYAYYDNEGKQTSGYDQGQNIGI